MTDSHSAFLVEGYSLNIRPSVLPYMQVYNVKHHRVAKLLESINVCQYDLLTS